MDYISRLPESILHDILNRLPSKDATRTCVLSKTWNLIQSRTPFLSFHDYDGHRFSSPTHIFSCLEKHLERLNDSNLPILSFAFHFSFATHENKDRLTSLLRSVMNNGRAQKLDLCIFEYRLPHFVFQSDTLTALSLCDCTCDTRANVCLPKLTALDISYADMDSHFVERLTRGCPLLQHIEIKGCRWLTTFRVTCLERLQTVSIIKCKDLCIIEIMSPNLHSFRYVSFSLSGKQCDLIFSPSKELTLEFTKFRNSWLQQQLSACEELTLSSIDFVDDIHISSQKLRRLKIKRSYTKNMPRIDCPNLQSLVYVDNVSVFRSVCEFKSLREVRVKFSSPQTHWDYQLTDLFQKFGSIKEFIKNIVFYKDWRESMIPEDSTQNEVAVISSISQLDKLVNPLCKSIILNKTPFYVASTTDCSNNDFSHVLFDKLVDKLSRIRAEANCCCQDRTYECWRHHSCSVSKESTTNIIPAVFRSQQLDQFHITTIQVCDLASS